MTFQIRSQDDQRRYQNPTADEVAVVYVGDDEDIPGKRGFTVHQHSGRLQPLHIIDPNCDPMSYPLLFPTGQSGWHPKIPYEKAKGKRQNVTMMEFYSYNLHVRNSFHPFFRAGKLFQQYVVDVWARVEQNRLNFLRQNQAQLRVESMTGLQDYVSGEEKGPIGSRILLPASHTGSPRDMVQQYQDAMSVVSKYGKPDYFITMTCNPYWEEIQEHLEEDQTATDRPDIVARVFQMKVNEFRDDIVKKEIFGQVQAYIFVIEFQKRGLPHLHMLLIMKTGSKPRTADSRAKETEEQKAARKSADRKRKSERPGALLGVAASGIEPDVHNFGKMDQLCDHCKARYFRAETTQKGQYTRCCSLGAIKFKNPKLPSTLQTLFLTSIEEQPGDNEEKKKLRKEAKNFRENLRQFNNSLAMASMKADVVTPSGGPYTYRIHKQVYHFVGDLHPAPGEPRRFAQVFIIDTAQAASTPPRLGGVDDEHLSKSPWLSWCRVKISDKVIYLLVDTVGVRSSRRRHNVSFHGCHGKTVVELS
ncbi:hypothetical protein B9Z55_009225 [Caenorhabditis nigoni]|uniref:Helitron helicase-like domain-containing protein n=1 Tax=Caenorhabditis nigoni TaxID=1611254 RepID=A0A2G5URK8_9PELO|nr:hypothetical protein B9Z55_009225 [Caenorhabditis nigoni]